MIENLIPSEEQNEEIFIEDHTLQCSDSDEFMDRKNEWEEIDDLVFTYQKQFKTDIEITDKIKRDSENAIIQLTEKFYPLFKKYSTLLKTGQINFENVEQKSFVYLFMDDKALKRALCSKEKIDRNTKSAIFMKFNFVKETYGHNEEQEIITDLQYLFLVLAKRYKKMERSFCCYVYNCFRYEVARHIQKFIRNPLNIHYKSILYEETLNSGSKDLANNGFDMEDKIYTSEFGIPDLTWVQGLTCSEKFSKLTPLERKILIKYYLEHYNDKQIAKEFGLHINTANANRRRALMKLCEIFEMSKDEIKRSRNSGNKKSV